MSPEQWKRLGRRLLFIAASVYTLKSLVVGIAFLREWGWCWDARAYYDAWDGGLYELAPGLSGAYNYSPLFAQLLWPVTQMPWVAFSWLMIAAAALGTWWLLRGTKGPWAVLLWAVCLPEIFSGNVYWVCAIVVVLGMKQGGWWAFPLLTKITPALGPLWFVARGEWRRLLESAAVVFLLCGVSAVWAPHLWAEWFGFLRDSLQSDEGASGVVLGLALWMRVLIGAALVVWAARTDRAWALPVAMVLVSPVVGPGTFALLAATPRLLRWSHDQQAVEPERESELSVRAGA